MTGRVVVIGASMGGIEALRRLVAALPAGFPAPILVAQHVGRGSFGFLPGILSRSGPLPALHPERPQPVEPGRIYVAPPDRHLLLENGGVRLSHGPKENFMRPAVDPLFRSAALDCGPAAIGVVLTGMLDDGTAGLMAIKDSGGTAIVQDPREAAAPSMPSSAMRHVRVDHCLPVGEIARKLVELAADAPSGDPRGATDTRLTGIEHRIACGAFDAADWQGLEERSRASGLNCPDCRSALYELREDRMLRYRCRSGHACTALALLGAQAQAHEAQLSALLALAAEESALARRLAARPDARDDRTLQAGLARRVEVLDGEAAQVAGWLGDAGRWTP